MTAIASSFSGYTAALQRLNVASDNVTNQQSKNYKPKEVTQTSQAAGGVETQVRERENPTVPVRDPNAPDGVSELPNVNTAEELINAKVATYDAEANLKAIQVQQKVDKATLDIIA